jgi:hypothetical protein
MGTGRFFASIVVLSSATSFYLLYQGLGWVGGGCEGVGEWGELLKNKPSAGEGFASSVPVCADFSPKQRGWIVRVS